MVLDEEVYRMYNELRCEITQCSMDVAILDYYQELQGKGRDMLQNYAFLHNYILRLAKKDLALTIWKILCDKDSKSNTVPKFRNKINGILYKNGLRDRCVETVDYEKETEALCYMRKTYLAHIDKTRESSRLEIQQLRETFKKLCEDFWRACMAIDDKKCLAIAKGEYQLEGFMLRCQIESLFGGNRGVQ